MRMNRIRGLVTRMLLVVSLLFGVIAMTGSTVQAQGWRRFDGHRGRVGRVFFRILGWRRVGQPLGG